MGPQLPRVSTPFLPTFPTQPTKSHSFSLCHGRYAPCHSPRTWLPLGKGASAQHASVWPALHLPRQASGHPCPHHGHLTSPQMPLLTEVVAHCPHVLPGSLRLQCPQRGPPTLSSSRPSCHVAFLWVSATPECITISQVTTTTKKSSQTRRIQSLMLRLVHSSLAEQSSQEGCATTVPVLQVM